MLVIFGKPNCEFCTKAIALAVEHELSYFYIDVTKDVAAKDWLKGLGFQTVPAIFQYAGGYTELEFDLFHKSIMSKIMPL